MPRKLESINSMLTWTRSKRLQAAISLAFALLSAVFVLANIATKSFNHFYFAPHEAYPHPYATLIAARITMCRDCGLTFIAAFAIFYLAQRFLLRTPHQNSDQQAERTL